MKVLNSGSYSLHGLLSSLFFWLQKSFGHGDVCLHFLSEYVCFHSLLGFHLAISFSLLLFYSVQCDCGEKMCEEIYGYFTILLEQFSMFIGGVFKVELFLPKEYPMAAPKVCWNCAFTQDHIITYLGLSTMLVSL
jgi:hypothetical protein